MRAVLLKHIAKLLMLIRSAKGNMMEFRGFKTCGVRGRPIFVEGESTTRCIARNAWSAGKANAEFDTKFTEHIVCYNGFSFGDTFMQAVVVAVLARGAPVGPVPSRRRLHTKTRVV